MTRVVVLRPEPGATETVARARGLGLEALAIPLFELEPVEWDVPDSTEFDALLLTSANAVRNAGEGLKAVRGLPVHAVGDATAAAARDAGFSVAAVGAKGVRELLEAADPGLRLLHLCGEHRTRLRSAIQRISVAVVYRSKAVEAPASLPEAEGSVVLAHSPRAARRFAELWDTHGLARETIRIAAISAATAGAAGGGWSAVEAADTPTDDALLALAARLCEKPSGDERHQ